MADDQVMKASDGTIYYVRPDGSTYRLNSAGLAPAQKEELKQIPAMFAVGGILPLSTRTSTNNSGGGGGSTAPSKADSAGATVPANSEKIDIRISDEILEEVNRLTLDIMQDSADLIPFNLSFNSIDFIPEREVFSADNETRYGIYFEDTETDQFVDVRNTESEDISLGIIRTKITDLDIARLNGTRRYFDAFTVKYDSNGTPEISLKIDTGVTGIDGLDVIILQIKDNIESFTRQDPPS
jgi:hypothetical protein